MLLESPHHRDLGTMGEFAVCLDAPAVLEACAEQLIRVNSETRARWCDAKRIESLYHPGRYLRVLYAFLESQDTPDNRYWPEGQLVYLHAPVREPMSRRGTMIRLGNVLVEGYTFPNDRRLRGLRAFTRRDVCARLWNDWISAVDPSQAVRPQSLQRLLVRYVPEQKWIVRLRAEERSVGSERKRRIALRCTTHRICETLKHRHETLRARLQGGLHFQIPGVVGARPDYGLLAVEWLRGSTLPELLIGSDPRGVFREIVLRLKAFHATPVSGLPVLDIQGICRRLESACADLQCVLPELTSELRKVSVLWQRCAQGILDGASSTLHNDFHWKQLSIKKDRFALLDLDRMSQGDPMIDVANFASQLALLAHRNDLAVTTETASLWRQSFLTEWALQNGSNLDERRLTAYSTLSRLELARGMMRHLREDWPKLARVCIQSALVELGAFECGGVRSW